MTAVQPGYSGSVPLSAPLYGASPSQAVRRIFAKYATFSGRASRSEYWWWWLASFVVTSVLQIIGLIAGGPGQMASDGTYDGPSAGYVIFSIVGLLWGVAVIVPSLAVLVRRLHDANFSGFFAFLALIPIVGPIIVLVLTVMPSNPQGARFDV